MVNAYFCDAGERDVLQEYIAGYPRYDTAFVCDVVVADTRGQAKAEFVRRRGYSSSVELTDVKARVLARGVERGPGVVKDSDPLWELVG